MGPISDQKGVEQGGVNSGDFYKIFGKSQLQLAQDSGLGVKLARNLVISSIGQADDTLLVSNSLHSLQNLLQLTLYFCRKFNVELCADKTRLQVLAPPAISKEIEYLKTFNPVNIHGKSIDFCETAEHVGVIRSVTGNLPNIFNRISSHKKALGAVLHSGSARHHRGNQAAGLKLEQLYAGSVLLSNIGALVLKKSELTLIDQYHKESIQNLLRLQPKSPPSVIYFLAGSLPGEALVHIKQLSLFGMISRLPDSVLYKHALNALISKTSSNSWFHQVRDLCLQYQLPHPLTILANPPTKDTFKNLIKKQIINFWEIQLRAEAAELKSLKYFKPNFMSLKTPHPLFLAAGSSPYEVAKAGVQAVMLSGRYRTERLCRFWSNNPSGYCLAPACAGLAISEDIEHILLNCSSLSPVRQRLVNFTIEYTRSVPVLSQMILDLTNPNTPLFLQFLLDCSSIPVVISAVQLLGHEVLHHLFKISRTWCYSLHRERLRLLGRWRRF